MDRDKFIILLASVVITVFFSIFFSFWFFLEKRPSQYYVLPKDMMHPPIDFKISEYFDQVDKVLENQQKVFEKLNEEFDKPLSQSPGFKNLIKLRPNSTRIKSEETNNFYKISVNLKSFNNDPKNISTEIKGNTITISAQYKKEGKDKFSSSKYYQSMTLPFKIDAKAVKKEQEGDFLIITVPKTEENKK